MAHTQYKRNDSPKIYINKASIKTNMKHYLDFERVIAGNI
jgi:hypothetical protein